MIKPNFKHPKCYWCKQRVSLQNIKEHIKHCPKAKEAIENGKRRF